MHLSFDIYNRIELPTLILCEIGKERLCSLFTVNISMNLNYTNVSELRFKVPHTIDGEPYRYYDEVKELRLIYIKDIGYFQIYDIQEVSDGIVTYKECVAYSAESMLQSKRITNLEGTYKLYDLLKPEESLLGLLLTIAPDWKVGHIDGRVLNRTRTLNISEKDVYSMLVDDFYTSYSCIFVFDFDKYEINIYDAEKEYEDTEIFISYYNLLKKATVSVQTSDIITALRVYGADGVDISGINPSGTNVIYNVSYFKDRMSSGLQDALNAYSNKINSLKDSYSSLLIQYKNKNSELSNLKSNAPSYVVDFEYGNDGTAKVIPALNNQSGLSELEALVKALEGVKAVRISQGNISYSDINSILITVKNMISSKKISISNTESTLSSLESQIKNINTQLKIENNFTGNEWNELNGYFRYNTLKEDSYVITDIMTQDEKQQVRQELYDYGNLVLSKSCIPKYNIDISAVNFLALYEYKKFHTEFKLGSTFTLEIKEGFFIKPILLGVSIDFSNLSNFTLRYGNKSKLENTFDFSAYKSSVNTTTSLSFDLVKIQAMANQKDDVTKFINGSLDLAKNNIISGSGRVDINFNENGLRIKEYDYSTGLLKPQELWVTGKQIVFSNDNFTTASMALGEINAPGSIGGKVYGVVADAIVGRLIAGNNLHIENTNNSFILDETGATLNNANFTITKGTTKILLDPSVGFEITRGTEKQMGLDSSGNAYFKGAITGGSININNQFLVSSSGDITIKRGSININNGQFSVDSAGYVVCNDIHIRNSSSLNLGSGNTYARINSNGYLEARGANIRGDIYAENGYFNGELGSSVVYTGRLSANQITTGSLSAIEIDGCSIYGGTIRGAYVVLDTLNVDYSIETETIYINSSAYFYGSRPRWDDEGLATLEDIGYLERQLDSLESRVRALERG